MSGTSVLEQYVGFSIKWLPICQLYFVTECYLEQTELGPVRAFRNRMSFQQKAQAERWIAERVQ